MSTESWQDVFAIFEECVELSPAERQAFLDRACHSDQVRRMVEEMLAVDEGDETYPLDRPLIERPLKSRQTKAEHPETIGAYRILRRLGQGGMSTVYLAVRADDTFRRHVVVKLVRRGMETEPILRRLRAERQILASLDHPYIARLYDGGSTEDGLPYFVMEFVEGASIDDYCVHNGLSLAERLTLFRKVCAAVQHAHRNLVIHRDIKPSNILVTADGDPRLLDFGIARLLNPDLVSAEVEPTATWQRIMTPSYASLEQIRGQQVTTTSDVYSLGVLLYKLLTGRLPRVFKGRSHSEIERMLAETEPPRPSAAEPAPGSTAKKHLVGDLDAIVLKALRTAPSQRYGSVEQLDADIDSYQRGRPVTARKGTFRYRAGKLVRRHRTAVAAATAVAVLIVGFVVAMVARSAQVSRERDQARLERDKKQEVLELILDIFRFSNPYVLPGEDLTVREALARSVPVLENGLRDQPEVRAELLYTSGSILNVLGSYGPAEHQLEEALDIRRQLYGEDHADIAKTMTALAATRKRLGKLEDAEDLALQSVELARGLRGDILADNIQPVLATALNELASVRCDLNEHDAAEGPALDALVLAREMPTEEQEIVSLEQLALIDTTRGDYVSAEARYRQALALRHERYGKNHPVQIDPLSNLGVVLRRMEEFEAAERVYIDLVDLQRMSFGEDFKDPYTLGNLAGLKFGQGDYADGAELYKEALEAVRQSPRPDHWMAYVFELYIEDAQIQLGKEQEAEVRIRSLLERWRPKLGDDNWRIGQGETLLGESLSIQGKCKDAEPILTEGYRRMLDGARERHRQDASRRLREHFERCGRPQDYAPYEAL